MKTGFLSLHLTFRTYEMVAIRDSRITYFNTTSYSAVMVSLVFILGLKREQLSGMKSVTA